MAQRRQAKRKAPRTKRGTELLSGYLLLTIVDELDHADTLLGMIPELNHASQLVREAEVPDRSFDELARAAREALGLDLRSMMMDDDTEELSELRDVPSTADAVLDAVRWRLRRLKKVLDVAAKATR